jgi:hypothetical protein
MEGNEARHVFVGGRGIVDALDKWIPGCNAMNDTCPNNNSHITEAQH